MFSTSNCKIIVELQLFYMNYRESISFTSGQHFNFFELKLGGKILGLRKLFTVQKCCHMQILKLTRILLLCITAIVFKQLRN